MRTTLILGAGCAMLMLAGQAMAEQPTSGAPQKTSAEHPDSDGKNPKDTPMQRAGSAGEHPSGYVNGGSDKSGK